MKWPRLIRFINNSFINNLQLLTQIIRFINNSLINNSLWFIYIHQTWLCFHMIWALLQHQSVLDKTWILCMIWVNFIHSFMISVHFWHRCRCCIFWEIFYLGTRHQICVISLDVQFVLYFLWRNHKNRSSRVSWQASVVFVRL